LLAPNIQIWAGGAGISVIRKRPKGVSLIYDFKDAIFALNKHPQQ
jgi:hypothetical protein